MSFISHVQDVINTVFEHYKIRQISLVETHHISAAQLANIFF